MPFSASERLSGVKKLDDKGLARRTLGEWATMKAMVVHGPGSGLEWRELAIPTPSSGEVRIRVEACGVCHGDALIVQGGAQAASYPRVPGHEVIGSIEAVGPDVHGWYVGDRVGVGWFCGCCGYCPNCRRKHEFACEHARGATGMSRDGGYATHMVASTSALIQIPAALDSVDAAPLLCAGVTTYNALRNCDVAPGSIVAVHGVGGLGHLAIQFASRMGFRTVAINRGSAKKQAALDLGAEAYIDSLASDPAHTLQKMGGAAAILATVTNSEAMASVVAGLRPRGVFIVLGAVGNMVTDTSFLILNEATLKGVNAGTPSISEEMLTFALHAGVTSRNVIFPLRDAQAAYDLMMKGQAQFKVVLTMRDEYP
jgi:alcohol dehydrogenase